MLLKSSNPRIFHNLINMHDMQSGVRPSLPHIDPRFTETYLRFSITKQEQKWETSASSSLSRKCLLTGVRCVRPWVKVLSWEQSLVWVDGRVTPTQINTFYSRGEQKSTKQSVLTGITSIILRSTHHTYCMVIYRMWCVQSRRSDSYLFISLNDYFEMKLLKSHLQY